MSTNVLFHEVQRFRQWWMWVPLLILELAFLGALVWQIGLGHPIGDHPAPDGLLVIIVIIVSGLSFLIFSMKLEVMVDKEGIRYRYTPFINTFKQVNFSELDRFYVRSYRPIMEYGGWGLRIGLFNTGQALNVSGHIGLQLVFKSGRKLLLGTSRGEQLTSVLEKLDPHHSSTATVLE